MLAQSLCNKQAVAVERCDDVFATRFDVGPLRYEVTHQALFGTVTSVCVTTFRLEEDKSVFLNSSGRDQAIEDGYLCSDARVEVCDVGVIELKTKIRKIWLPYYP